VTSLVITGNLADYEARGGDNWFAYTLAELLVIDISQIGKISAKQGSVVVGFTVYSISTAPSVTAETLKSRIETAYAQGKLNLFGTQVVSSGTNIISLTGCEAGQYLDSDSVCRACPDGCDTCSSADEDCKTNVGAIVGGVIGGVAFVVIVVIIYLKRNAIKNLISPKGNYNKVASTPTNVQKA